MNGDKDIPALDGVRGLAILLVVIYHAGWQKIVPYIDGSGQLGVMLFFALSGFLMNYHYAPGERSHRYWLGYITRRVFRVYPVFLATVLLCGLAYYFTGYSYFSSFDADGIVDHLLLSAGFYHLWTIAVEMKFYVFFPCLMIVFLFFPQRTSYRQVILAGLWLGFSCLPVDLIKPGLLHEKLSFWHYLPYFITGMMAANFYRSPLAEKMAEKNLWDKIAIICTVIIAVILPAIDTLNGPQRFISFIYSGYYSPLMGLAVLSIAQSNHSIRRLFSSRSARFLGQISYSLYLCHVFIFHISFASLPLPMIPGIVFNGLFVLIIALILYRFVEMPCNKLGKSLTHRFLEK